MSDHNDFYQVPEQHLLTYRSHVNHSLLLNLQCQSCHRKRRRRRGKINSEGFLAEVFHPWVRWEGPGSGFENSSGPAPAAAASGWAQAGPKWVGPRWAQVGGPTPGPSGWAHAGPKWVGPRGWAQAGRVGPSQAQVGGPRIHRFAPLGIEVEKQGFRTVRLITGQKFP